MAKHIFLVFVEVNRSADMQIMHILITKIAFKPNLTKLGWHGPCVVPFTFVSDNSALHSTFKIATIP